MCERDMSFNHLRWAWCILLIQRRSNLLCMLCSERQRKKNMNDRKSKFASINCEHGRKNRLLVNINGGFLFIYTLSGTFGVVGFFFISSVFLFTLQQSHASYLYANDGVLTNEITPRNNQCVRERTKKNRFSRNTETFRHQHGIIWH